MNRTNKFIVDCFDYDPISGDISFKKQIPCHYYKNDRSRLLHRRFLGKKIGYKKKRPKTNYIEVKTLGFRFSAHRAAWIIYHGYVPNIIDHIDHNGENNAIKNLRETNHQGNARNNSLYSTNKSGVVGVSFDKRRSKWKAEICVDYKNIFIGYFESIEEAAEARESASAKHGFHANHCKQLPPN